VIFNDIHDCWIRIFFLIINLIEITRT